MSFVFSNSFTGSSNGKTFFYRNLDVGKVFVAITSGLYAFKFGNSFFGGLFNTFIMWTIEAV